MGIGVRYLVVKGISGSECAGVRYLRSQRGEHYLRDRGVVGYGISRSECDMGTVSGDQGWKGVRYVSVLHN